MGPLALDGNNHVAIRLPLHDHLVVQDQNPQRRSGGMPRNDDAGGPIGNIMVLLNGLADGHARRHRAAGAHQQGESQSEMGVDRTHGGNRGGKREGCMCPSKKASLCATRHVWTDGQPQITNPPRGSGAPCASVRPRPCRASQARTQDTGLAGRSGRS